MCVCVRERERGKSKGTENTPHQCVVCQHAVQRAMQRSAAHRARIWVGRSARLPHTRAPAARAFTSMRCVCALSHTSRATPDMKPDEGGGCDADVQDVTAAAAAAAATALSGCCCLAYSRYPTGCPDCSRARIIASPGTSCGANYSGRNGYGVV